MAGLVTRLLDAFLSSVFRRSMEVAAYEGDPAVLRFERVSNFWRSARSWNLEAPPGPYVRLSGVVSHFGPVVPADPFRKRDAHRYLRRNYEEILRVLAENGHPEGNTTLDALLSFTAGQMVARVPPAPGTFVYLGLYQSIVRNSIPLFVRQDYFTKHLAPALSGKPPAHAFEASVSGRLLPMPDNFVAEFLRTAGMYDFLEHSGVGELTAGFGLQVDGEDSDTWIEPTGQARYLDGDIWVAIQEGSMERVVTRFLDLSDPIDVTAERAALKAEIEGRFGQRRVISEYDAVDPIFPGGHVLHPSAIRRREQKLLAPPTEAGKGVAAGAGPAFPMNLNVRTLVINMPDNVQNIAGDNYSISGSGIVNIRSKIENATQTVTNSTAMDSGAQNDLVALLEEMSEELHRLSDSHKTEAERVADAVDSVAKEAAREKPDRSYLQVTVDGLKAAASALEGVAPTVFGLATKIAALVLA